MKVREKITLEQTLEWLDNPVTQVFKETVQEERDATSQAIGVEVYHPYQPERTQEVLCSLNAAVDTWDQVLYALDPEGIRDAFEEDEDGE